MITTDEKALFVLNRLIRAGRDSELGFLAAADGVPDPELVQLFAGFAVQRAKATSDPKLGAGFGYEAARRGCVGSDLAF